MKTMTRRIGLAMAVLCLMSAGSGIGEAGQIIGPSTLVGAADLDQLEAWLGEGELNITNVFTKVQGDGKTATQFHAAVDGIGRTFSVLEVLDTNGNGHQIIGGYNPSSWNSSVGHNFSYSDSDRDAFLFNLTSGGIQRQGLSSAYYGYYGFYQTYNSPVYGPTFGGGHDLYVDFALQSGYAYNFSYGDSPFGSYNILGKPYGGGDSISYGRIEVFTIAPAALATAVPEPGTIALVASGLPVGVVLWLKRRRKAAVT